MLTLHSFKVVSASHLVIFFFFSIAATLRVQSEDECGRLLQFLLAVEFGVYLDSRLLNICSCCLQKWASLQDMFSHLVIKTTVADW